MADIIMRPIAHIETPFSDKFGIPRQSGVVKGIMGRIVFEPEYRSPEAFRGLEGFSHLWIIWQFSKAVRDTFSPTVRPPRLNGNTRMGVFATRSPFRPNSIAMSCVKIEDIKLHTPQGPVITVSGVDMLDDTPVLDIKPYIPYADSIPDAKGGFTSNSWERTLTVNCDNSLLSRVPQELRDGLIGVLENDPRPSYKQDSDRVYGMSFAGMEVKFIVNDGILTVSSIEGAEQ